MKNGYLPQATEPDGRKKKKPLAHHKNKPIYPNKKNDRDGVWNDMTGAEGGGVASESLHHGDGMEVTLDDFPDGRMHNK